MTESENEVDFWNEQAKKIGETIRNTMGERVFKDILVSRRWWEESLPKLENKKMLDIGCGSRINDTAYWEIEGNESYGIDISRKQIENSIILHKKIGINDRFVVSSAVNIPFKDNCFDVVSMNWLIHHIPSALLNTFMQEVNRVLRKNGLVLIFETNYSYPLRWITQTNLLRKINYLRKTAIKKGMLDPDEKALTYKGYVRLLEENGFRVMKTGFYPRRVSLIALLFSNKVLLQMLSKMDIVLTKYIPHVFSDDISIIARKYRIDANNVLCV